MQKHWHYNRRSDSAFSFFENESNIEKSTDCEISDAGKYATKFEETSTCVQLHQVDPENVEEEDLSLLPTTENLSTLSTILIASDLGDIPAYYKICHLENHQFPVIGVYIDRRVVPGFKYRVQRLRAPENSIYRENYLFNGKSLVLLNIGRGYARRFTFETDKSFPNEENYFYSDNHQEGYAFELQTISNGDKFTIFDVNHEPQGILEILKVNKKQVEIGSICNSKEVEKRVKVKFTAKVEFYDSGVSKLIRLTGTAVCLKSKHERLAKTVKIVDINIKHHRYYLIPGYKENYRRIHLNGDDIGDVPTRYTITGLKPHEMPVIGTYVDARILPGFYYKVRPANRQQPLFNGKALRLQSIGPGYAKKIAFESDSAVDPNNYLWSDNHQDGLAFETRAVHEKMRFSIMAGSQTLGEAEVFRANLPQIEERMERIRKTNNNYSYIKYIHVDVMCHVKMDINDSGDFYNENLMRVYGLAVVRRDSDDKEAYLERIQNIGLDSQLNVIFARADIEITFVSIK